MSTARRDVVVQLPYAPRRWQAREHAAWAKSGARHSIWVVHRRGGKTVLAVKELVTAACETTRSDARYAYIAPLLGQAKRVAWDYMRAMTAPIPGVDYNLSELSVGLPNGARIRLLGADDPASLRGPYYDGIVLDELADMRPEVWGEVLYPALSDRRGWSMMIGTPRGVDLLSELYHSACDEANTEWYARRLTVYDTDVFTPKEIDEIQRGMTERAFRQEYLCDFAAGATDTLLGLDLCITASRRHYRPEEYSFAPRVAGIDVAYVNDSTVCYRRQGLVAHRPLVIRNRRTNDQAVAIANELRPWAPDAVFIDNAPVAFGLIDALRTLGVPLLPIDFGGAANHKRYVNKRSEIWHQMARWVEDGGAIPPEQDLLRDLSSIKVSHDNAASKFALESKDNLKTRGLPSPDHGDALALTFGAPVTPRVEAQSSDTSRYAAAIWGQRTNYDYDPMGDV